MPPSRTRSRCKVSPLTQYRQFPLPAPVDRSWSHRSLSLQSAHRAFIASNRGRLVAAIFAASICMTVIRRSGRLAEAGHLPGKLLGAGGDTIVGSEFAPIGGRETGRCRAPSKRAQSRHQRAIRRNGRAASDNWGGWCIVTAPFCCRSHQLSSWPKAGGCEERCGAKSAVRWQQYFRAASSCASLSQNGTLKRPNMASSIRSASIRMR